MTLRTSSRRRTRLAAVALGVSALMLGATACSSGGGAPSGSATLWGLTGTDEDTVLGPSLKEWNGANADGQIAATYFQNDAYKTKIRTAVGAGSAPTIIYSWAGGTLNSYVDAGKVADITSETADAKGKFLESVWNQGVIDDKVYAVPMNATTPIMFYYNKDVLKAAGVEVPTNFDEIVDAIPKLKAAGVAPFSLAGASKWPSLMWEEYLVDRVAGPEAFNKIMAGEADAWSDPGIIEANEKIQELVKAGAFVDGYASVTADSNADVALLYTGKAAMMLQGAWVMTTFKQQAAEFAEKGLGYTTFPAVTGGKGDPSNIVGNPSGYFSISASATKEQKASALKYLTEGVFDKGYIDRMVKAGQVPPITDIDAEIADAGGDFGTTVYDLTKNAKNFQMSWDQALPPAQATALLTNLDQLFNLQITPQEFSDNMNKTIGQ
ncbi:extracellular solute-binding protein [Plantibacter sp. VKM Ac-2885]|jgi:raffinose/stachyose/melibiose transport system substrate-binding protein|uniref:extracellular solute-binding protein n=1 Tax=Plantibacter TaxID=190323 RepID=UPI000F5F7542|nr:MULTISPECIES: extracellular solute-binding protein [Plantibacter]AZH84742.1 extracellular solute-binding protein [Plantibacter sp. PA-3-X8]MBF4513890.1 extracellular solute-binding protein [Plantibacter sp. VKM Ac-2885]MBF4566429.1 extracellular solute-binding protein [Plantibacter sp. VKM Ac-2876]CAH0233467.1 Multiple sugar-binding protein [Plantibacter cousiniae]